MPSHIFHIPTRESNCERMFPSIKCGKKRIKQAAILPPQLRNVETIRYLLKLSRPLVVAIWQSDPVLAEAQ